MTTQWIAAVALLGAGLAIGSPRAEAATSPQQMAESAGRGLIGSPAPKLVLKTIDGQKIDLAALYGKRAVYLKFWATWCVPCRRQMPHFQHAFEHAGDDLAVIAIDSGFNDSVDAVRAAQRELGMTMPIVLDDGAAGAAFNLRVTPQHIVIGRDGRIRYIGHLADERVDAEIAAARAESAPAIRGASEPARARHYSVGDSLPDLSTTLLDGTTFRTHAPSSKRPTVLVFMSPWCESYLAKSRPAMAASCRKAALDESGEWFRSFHVQSVPAALVADADGKIVRRFDGFLAGLPAELHELSER